MEKSVKDYRFLFKQLVKRDFQKRYKKTALGMMWSVLSPLCDFIVMKFVFTYLFGRTTPHFSSYLFSGLLITGYFSEATSSGMNSLVANSGIISKINVPKYIFLLSKNVASIINFGLTFLVYCVFLIIDHITFTWKFVLLLYPVLCLVILNIGMGLILSALFVFFKDTSYLYGIFLKLLTYLSAVFYTVDRLPEKVQQLLYINPIYDYITYFRQITIYGTIPDAKLHIFCAAWALAVLAVGCVVYKVNNYKFVFYF
ncbi:MAG: ABC transporter permease [Oscillospiraceae bacterium]